MPDTEYMYMRNFPPSLVDGEHSSPPGSCSLPQLWPGNYTHTAHWYIVYLLSQDCWTELTCTLLRLISLSLSLSLSVSLSLCLSTGAISHAKLQSNHHHQQTNTQFFYQPDAVPVAQPTVSKHWREMLIQHLSWSCVFTSLSSDLDITDSNNCKRETTKTKTAIQSQQWDLIAKTETSKHY